MANKNFTPFNVCTNWGLKCFEMKVNEHKGVSLSCALNGKKKEDGTYPKATPVRVWCSFDNCKIEEGDYANSYINVDGQIAVGEYTKKDGEVVSQLTIFATKVTKKEWDNK